MTTLLKVLEAPLDQNLHALSVYWWQQELPHKISEVSGCQVIWIESAHLQARILDDYQAFCDGRLAIKLEARQRPPIMTSLLGMTSSLIRDYPITLVLVGLSVLGFLLVELDQKAIVDLLRIQSVDSSSFSASLNLNARISPAEYLSHGQYWRLITPIFLHFGWVHITFNMLWLWELGRRIEKQGGAIHFVSVVFFIGIASNLYQAASTPYDFFGGMSGVIFGLLGYCAVFNFIVPQKLLSLPKELYIIMLISLFVGMSGIFDFLGKVANAAHLSGLVWGAFIGLPSALLARFFFTDKKAESNDGSK